MFRGPVFLNDLVGVLLRFRLPNVAIVSDVEKAFLQIELQRHHRDCTRFLWLQDTSKFPTPDNIVVYRYARVTFGVKASPFLLAATITHHAMTEATSAALDVKNNTYMDNVIGGRENTEQARQCYSDAKALFRQIRMNLRGWYINDSDFITGLPVEDQGKSPCPSVLGLKWDTSKDRIHCASPSVPEESGVATKRQILKFVASTYDPCGWFSPVTIRGKTIMQQLWKAKTWWDEPVEQPLRDEWQAVRADLAHVSDVQIPRRVEQIGGDSQRHELHAFSDASTLAYACSVYLVTRQGSKATSDLLFAKNRVAPVKLLTVPKLELMAAVLAVRLLKFVSSELNIKVEQQYLWADSTCVLGWLQNDKVNVVFVENRLREIRSSPSIHFGHVKTHENPADIPSRGAELVTLRSCDLWLKGPEWLRMSWSHWPKQACAFVRKETAQELEVVQDVQAAPVQILPDPLVNPSRFSSLTRLLRVTAYVFRAIRKMRWVVCVVSNLTADELKNAREFWEKQVQSQVFSAEYQRSAEWKNQQKQLGLYQDDKGFWRCKGRYANARMSSGASNPKPLPGRHPFTRLVIQRYHSAAMHTGLKGALCQLRLEYWIPRGRSIVKNAISKCQLCRVLFAGPFRTPGESPLPDFRSQLTRPFAAVGADYLGPLFICVAGQREKQKVWVALCACAAVRAVHLELANTMSVQDFLLSLRRFMAIYGTPNIVVSDNAKQFDTASRALDQLWQEAQQDATVQDFAAAHGLSWKFIPEKAPWFGGFYERLVPLVKRALRASLGKWTFTSEELRTLLYEVSCLC